MTPGITDLGATAAEESQSNSADEYSEYERYDLSQVDGFGKFHPTAAVKGTLTTLRKLYDEDTPDRSDVALIFENPAIVTSEPTLEESVVVESNSDTGDDYKVVNLDDTATAGLTATGKDADATTEQLDELNGVDFDSNTFYGAIDQAFPESMETVALKVGGSAGQSFVSTLDVAGGRAARELIDRDDDGEITDMTLNEGGFPAHNGGYMEYDPRDDGDRPRQSRDPELRPDVKGTEVIVMVQRLSEIQPDYDGRAYWGTVFANLDDERAQELAEQYAADDDDKVAADFFAELDGDEYLKLQPTDEFEPDEALVEETGWIDFPGNTFDNTDPDEVSAVNEARLADDHDNVFIPEGMDVADAVPSGVEVDGVEITAFGQGAPESLQADDE